MKLEKLFTVFMLLILALTIAPMALADDATVTVGDDVVVSVDDEAEVVIMNTPLGAEVRLTQLEASLERNILLGEDVIAKIEESDSEYDLTILNGILDELNALVVEVQSLDVEGDSTELAQSFVEIKADARELSKSFREEVVASKKLSDDDREELKAQVKKRANKDLEFARTKMIQARNNFNAEKAKELMTAFGVDADSFIQDIESGELSLAEIRSQVRAEFVKASDEDKAALRAQLREAKMKQKVFKKSSLDGVENMIQKRLQTRSESMDELRNRWQNHLNDVLNNGNHNHNGTNTGDYADLDDLTSGMGDVLSGMGGHIGSGADE